MKKFLNISLLLLLLGLFGSLSCRSWLRPKDTSQTEPNFIDELNWNQTLEGRTAVQQADAMASPSQERMSAGDATRMITVNEIGSSMVSRTYPWPECGIVQLDKIMPKEVGLNKPFNYTIKITNLTDTVLSGIMISEQIPSNFKFINANPTAKEENNKLVWDMESLGAKAVRTIKISGLADYAEPLKHCTTVLTPVIPAFAK